MIELTVTLILILVAVGLIFGVGSGVTGISAVNLIMPMLITIYAFSYYGALGTSLFIDMVNSGVVAYFYARHKNVDFKVGLLMGLVCFIFAIIGAVIAFSIAEQLLITSFGWLQLALGIVFIWRGLKWTGPQEDGLVEPSSLSLWFNKVSDKYKRITFIVAGMIFGLFGGLLGAGGGFIITFLLIFLLGFESHKAVGTACFVMLFTTGGAVLYYAIQGTVDLGIGGILAPVSLIGAFLGTQAAHKLSEKHLTIVLGVIICLFGILMIIY